MPPFLSLDDFVAAVKTDCLTAVRDDVFCAHQQSLLSSCYEHLFSTVRPSDWGHPLGLFYAIYRICGAEKSDVAVKLGTFCAGYVASADLFDDVQDDDLTGKSHAQESAAIATNSALTLLTLALDALGEAMALERRPKRRLRYLRLFNRVSLIAVGAQHKDLLGSAGAQSRAEVEGMQRGKTSSIALLCECAALAGGADTSTARAFYQIGEELASAVQIIDDVRDLVAKSESPDLASGKSTYPLACFLEVAQDHQEKELQRLLLQGRIDVEAVATLLEEAGTFDLCARAVETRRQRIFSLLDSAQDHAHGRLLCEIVDHLAGALYDPPPRPPREHPGSEFQQAQAAVAREFSRHMRPRGFMGTPALRPWHLPFYLYVPERQEIFFSDLDGLREEILPTHEQLLDLDSEATERTIRACMPFLVVHELVHAWRDQLGLLSDNAWHEEYIANSVALAYVREHQPQAASAVLFASQRTLAGPFAGTAQERIHRQQLVESSRSAKGQPSDYGATPEQAALIHAEMLTQLGPRNLSLEDLVGSWLTGSPLAAE